MRALPLLLVLTGCADLSGLNDYTLPPGEVNSRASSTTSAGGQGLGGNDGGAGAGAGGDDANCRAMDGSFGAAEPVVALDVMADDDDPTFGGDALELIFNSERGGQRLIHRSLRATTEDVWGAATPVDELNTMTAQSNPVLAPDGLTIWLGQSTGGATEFDIYVASRQDRTSAWSAPVRVPELSSADFDTPGAVTQDELYMVGSHGSALFEATRPSRNDPWTTKPLDELNVSDERAPWLDPQGLRIYWTREQVIWRAERSAMSEPFAQAGPVLELNAIGAVEDPWLSCDERYVLFSAGQHPDRRIYQARR